MASLNLLEWPAFPVRAALTTLEDLGGGSGDEVLCSGPSSAGSAPESEGLKLCSVGASLPPESPLRKDLLQFVVGTLSLDALANLLLLNLIH